MMQCYITIAFTHNHSTLHVFVCLCLAQDFEETLQLIKDYKFPSLFINQFFARPGTPAAKMNKIPAQEVWFEFAKYFFYRIFLGLAVSKYEGDSS